MSYQLIVNNKQLQNFCEKIVNSTSIAIDTEFVRTRTFYPKLGLIQIYDGEHAALIDPLTITKWDSLLGILSSVSIEKYVHASSEDIEVFKHTFNCIPAPLIDSQVLASFLDNPISAGYASLVKKYLNIELDKSETRTDWLKRPLSEKQCQYAINDVIYLFPLMHKLKERLTDNGWLNAAYEESELIINRKNETIDIDDAYLHIKNSWQLTGRALGQLKKLAAWRYQVASNDDIALNFVVHEDVLWAIAKYANLQTPTTLAELESLGMRGKEIRLYGNSILSLLSQPTQELPAIKRIINYPNYKQIAAELKTVAEAIAGQTGLNKELLISRRMINHYVKWREEGQQTSSDSNQGKLPEILSGWRKPLFSAYDLMP